jgi:chromosome partitioning protein
MPAPVFAVLNMKGGVGKTTLAVNVFRQLYSDNRKSVLLVDLDPQYNLTQQVISQDRYDAAVAADKAVLRLFEPAPASDFFSVNTSSNTPPLAREISERLRSFGKTDIALCVVPGSFDLTKYSFIENGAKLSHAKEYFKKFISEARNSFDIVVLDMNPSSSFLTFAGLSVATDVISPVRPDKFSMLGLRLVRRLMEHPQVANQMRLHIIMNGVKRSEGMTDTEAEIRATDYFKDCILTNRIYHSGVLAARTDHTGFAIDRKVPHKTQVKQELQAVEAELRGRIGL